MLSDTATEQRRAREADAYAGALLVLWQHPDTREIVPIGRLSHSEGIYSFSYTRAASQIADFRPLPGLAELRRRYQSPALPAVFGQRVMDSDRPDFASYASSLGLSPETATPWEQIVESGGERAGDTLQFMQLPHITNGRVNARFLANGIRHIPDTSRVIDGRTVSVTRNQHETALQALAAGDRVSLVAEQENVKDLLATLVTAAGTPLGYVPRFLARCVRDLLAHDVVEARVVRIGVPSTPSHLRLVLELDTPSPDGFELDRESRWEPISRSTD